MIYIYIVSIIGEVCTRGLVHKLFYCPIHTLRICYISDFWMNEYLWENINTRKIWNDTPHLGVLTRRPWSQCLTTALDLELELYRTGWYIWLAVCTCIYIGGAREGSEKAIEDACCWYIWCLASDPTSLTTCSLIRRVKQCGRPPLLRWFAVHARQ
jgi:hypothetical protein